VTTVFKNQPQDQLATKIPISGVYTNSTVDLPATIGTLLRNAFIRALIPKFDQKITTGEVARKVKQGQIPHADVHGTPTNAPNPNNVGVVNPGPSAGKPRPATLLEAPEQKTNLPTPPP
jgi:hypothetical protein